jgi:hypothetical protein
MSSVAGLGSGTTDSGPHAPDHCLLHSIDRSNNLTMVVDVPRYRSKPGEMND